MNSSQTRSTDARYEPPVLTRNAVGLMNKVGQRGNLLSRSHVEGVPIAELVASYGSPLFVFSERVLRGRIREAKAAFDRHYPDTRLCWSYKTNYLGAICAVHHREGSLAEVVSGMEYEKARRLGVPGDHIVFNGPAKTEAELRRAVQEHAVIHADHAEELRLLERIAEDTGQRPVVGIRVSLDAGIHPRWDRFGFALESGGAEQAVRRIVSGGRLAFGGLHSHIGTYVLDAAAYGRAARKLVDFATHLEANHGVRASHLDLGGGFASNNTLATQYHSGELVPRIDEYAAELGAALRDHGGRWPLLVETGRALVDDSGTLLATVLATKRLASGKRSLVIDAGVNLLFTAWWYRLQVTPARAVDGFVEDTTVHGPLCMNIDCVRESVALPALVPGDHLSISPVGAYCVTQSMQFIHLRPAIVLLGEGGEVELIRRAERLEDLVAPEVVPERLALQQPARLERRAVGS